MHADLEQLLSLRDGAPVEAGWRAHVEACAQCRRELARLCDVRDALQGMPTHAAPAGTWARVLAHLDATGAAAAAADAPAPTAPLGGSRRPPGRPARGARQRRFGVRQAVLEGMLASAVAVLAVVSLRLWSGAAEVPAAPAVPAAGAADRARPIAMQQVAPVPTYDQLLSKVRAQEAVLEQVALDAPQDGPAQARRQTLKEQIALLDHYCLTQKNLSPEEDYRLLAERVVLMDELLAAYGAEGRPRAVPARYESGF